MFEHVLLLTDQAALNLDFNFYLQITTQSTLGFINRNNSKGIAEKRVSH